MGNFPFIRQELIEKAVPGYKKETLEKAIVKDWLVDYPDAFTFPSNREAALAHIKDNPDAPKDVTLNLSGQADIYAYLFFHTARFVKEGGRMGFITSNSWLDVGYGFEVQKYMVNNFKIVAILESRCEPWFEAAAVNTVVTILERCSEKQKRDDNIVSFVKIKKTLAELIPWDGKVDPAKRWYGLDGLVQKIEAAVDKKCYVIDRAGRKCTLESVGTDEDDDFRIRFVKQSELKSQLDKEQRTAKWGQYLRAPQVYFDLAGSHGDRFISLNRVATVKFAIKTGVNDFFYLDQSAIKHWRIEDEFLAPVLKSPKESDTIAIDTDTLKLKVLLCGRTKSELRKARKTGVLNYIEWGERQVTKTGTQYAKGPTVAARNLWYSLPSSGLTKILWTKSYDTRFLQRYSETPLLADQRVYLVHPIDPQNDLILAAILNTTLCSLSIELIGRLNLGEGALDTTVEEAQDYTNLPDYTRFTPEMRQQITQEFQKISHRPIKSIFEEVKMKDRQKLDSLVLEAMGLDPAKYLKPIYDGLTELVRERIGLASMRKPAKKGRQKQNAEKVVETVTQELIANGIKTFPADFLSVKPKPQDCEDVSVPDAPLRLGDYFMGRQKVVDGSSFEYDAPSPAAAKYIVYARKPGAHVVCLPYIENLASKGTQKAEDFIAAAVQRYEVYLKDLRNQVFKDIHNRTFDYKLAETLSRRIFQDLGLPLVV